MMKFFFERRFGYFSATPLVFFIMELHTNEFGLAAAGLLALTLTAGAVERYVELKLGWSE